MTPSAEPGKFCTSPLCGVDVVTRGSLILSSFPSSPHGFHSRHEDGVAALGSVALHPARVLAS